jgi:hypothetical protein
MALTWRTVSRDWLSSADGVRPPIWGVAMRFSRNAADNARLVDEVAARQFDEEGVPLHARQRRPPDQVFGLLVGDRETDDKVRSDKQIVERSAAPGHGSLPAPQDWKTSQARLPRITGDALAGIAARHVGEFAFEGRGERDAVAPFYFG